MQYNTQLEHREPRHGGVLFKYKTCCYTKRDAQCWGSVESLAALVHTADYNQCRPADTDPDGVCFCAAAPAD